MWLDVRFGKRASHPRLHLCAPDVACAITIAGQKKQKQAETCDVFNQIAFSKALPFFPTLSFSVIVLRRLMP